MTKTELNVLEPPRTLHCESNSVHSAARIPGPFGVSELIDLVPSSPVTVQLDSETVLATRRLAAVDCFSSMRVVTVPTGEEAAANSLRVNDRVLVPAGFPATADRIAAAGYVVEVVPVSQANLLDGGLSCMSLRLPVA